MASRLASLVKKFKHAGEIRRPTREKCAVSQPQLLVHDKKDNVGVVVVEGVKAGSNLLGVVLEDDSDFHVTPTQDVQIGHKIALKDMAEGDTVVKYGQDIGRIVATTKKGDHVHVQNLKTKRW
jgi:(2R)-sulfolactate sulfo-lyase subunit alpha